MAPMTRRRPAAGPVLGMAVTAPLGAWLAARALAAGSDLSAGAAGAGDLADVVGVSLLWTGCAAAVWYFATCAAVVAALLARAVGAGSAHLERAVVRWGFPLLRRTLLSTVAAGASLSLTVGAAGAAQSAHEAPLPQDLGWGAGSVSAQPTVGAQIGAAILTTAPEELQTQVSTAALARSVKAPPTSEQAATAATSEHGTTPATSVRETTPSTSTITQRTTPSSSEQAATYLVKPGDSLWSIAEAHLPAAADAQVVQAWPRWYAANRSTVGPDPHLIRPGQLLHIPDEEAS